MSDAPLVKIKAATAAEVCTRYDVKPETRGLLQDGMNPREFMAALFEKKKFVDAIDFLAHALPAREGLWWGCLCLQHALGDNLPPPDKAAAVAAVRWVMAPNEENRAAARAPAEAAGPASVAGSLAVAASQTGGSIAPPNAPPVPPPPFAPAKAIARAIKLASTKSDPANLAKVQRSYLELGMEVAEGRYV